MKFPAVQLWMWWYRINLASYLYKVIEFQTGPEIIWIVYQVEISQNYVTRFSVISKIMTW